MKNRFEIKTKIVSSRMVTSKPQTTAKTSAGTSGSIVSTIVGGD